MNLAEGNILFHISFSCPYEMLQAALMRHYYLPLGILIMVFGPNLRELPSLTRCIECELDWIMLSTYDGSDSENETYSFLTIQASRTGTNDPWSSRKKKAPLLVSIIQNN